MNAYLLPSIEFGPRIIQRLLVHVPADRLDTPLHPDRFTAREAEDLANLLLGHDLYHIEQLTEYLAAPGPR